MKAYCIVYERRIHDPKMFEEYRKQVMATLEAYGAKFLVRGGKFTALEGEMPFDRFVRGVIGRVDHGDHAQLTGGLDVHGRMEPWVAIRSPGAAADSDGNAPLLRRSPSSPRPRRARARARAAPDRRGWRWPPRSWRPAKAPG